MSDIHPVESRNETILCAVLFTIALLAAGWMRFDRIGIKPFHHDEGVNSYFLLNLAKTGDYKYNPENYHGPSLYYFALVAMKVFGQNDFALRFMPALFGMLTVLLVWPLRRHLGVMGTPAAAFFLALSPGLVYYSRDFIHEMLFGCFLLGVIVGAWRYAESKQFLWLALAAVSLGLMIATKETVVVNLGVLAVALVCAVLWDTIRKLAHDRMLTVRHFARSLKRDVAEVWPTLDHALAATILVVFIHLILYSSFFKNWPGPLDFFRSILHWTKERSGQDHVHPFYYYLGILLKLELPLLAGSLLAGAIVLLKGTRFWLFLAASTLGTTLAYSIIPYKTPWLIVSFLVLMALMCGYAAEQVYRLFAGDSMISMKLLWTAVIALFLFGSGQMAWQVNFNKHDDNTNGAGYFESLGRRLEFKPYVDGQYGYVYAQTDRDFLFLVEAIRNRADKLPTGKHTGIYVASPDYWPLPWYLREYDQAAFSGSLPAAPPQITQPLIVARDSQRAELDALPDFRAATQPFKLRPGVELLLYERNE
jgi:uncharacterized protein (TIGR03663 family)